jgi:Protein of unknown function (DUF4235)
MIKLLYKPAGMIANVLGGLLAGAISNNGWKIAAREDDAPTATDTSRGWHEVLLAAAIEGLSSPCQGSARPRRRRGYAQADRHLARRGSKPGQASLGKDPLMNVSEGEIVQLLESQGQHAQASRARSHSWTGGYGQPGPLRDPFPAEPGSQQPG